MAKPINFSPVSGPASASKITSASASFPAGLPLVFGVIHPTTHGFLLGAVIGAAMIINNLVAGLSGVLIPVTLDRLDVDPAVSSAVFVTMMTDVMGFFSFLGLATLAGLGG